MDNDFYALNQHLEAARKMVELKGGIDNVGVNGYLGKLVVWCVAEAEPKKQPRMLPCSVTPISSKVIGFVTEVNSRLNDPIF